MEFLSWFFGASMVLSSVAPRDELKVYAQDIIVDRMSPQEKENIATKAEIILLCARCATKSEVIIFAHTRLKTLMQKLLFPEPVEFLSIPLSHFEVPNSLEFLEYSFDMYQLKDPDQQDDGWSCGYRMLLNAVDLASYVSKITEESGVLKKPERLFSGNRDLQKEVTALVEQRRTDFLQDEITAFHTLVEAVIRCLDERNGSIREVITMIQPGKVLCDLVKQLRQDEVQYLCKKLDVSIDKLQKITPGFFSCELEKLQNVDKELKQLAAITHPRLKMVWVLLYEDKPLKEVLSIF